MVLCPGAPEGLIGPSGSGFKASQKTGPLFNVSSDRLVALFRGKEFSKISGH